MTIKSLLPFVSFVLTTELSTDEVLKRVAENIQEKEGSYGYFFRPNHSRPYTGEIVGSSFTLFRNIDYRNSFRPVIKGKVTRHVDKTQVDIHMRPLPFVLIFMSFWLGVVGLICMLIVYNACMEYDRIIQGGFGLPILVPFVMFILGIIDMHYGFTKEVKISKDFLSSLFEGVDA